MNPLLPPYHWENESLHDTMEAMGAIAAIIMALFLFILQKNKGESKLFLMALGFLSLGLLNSFHAVAQPNGAFVWLRLLSGLGGSFWFALIWLPERIRIKLAQKKWLPWSVACLCLMGGMWALLFTRILPAPVYHHESTPLGIVINLITGLFFLAASVRLLLDFTASGEIETYLFACMTLLLGLNGQMFKYSDIWGWAWWLDHLMNQVAYLLGLGFVVKSYNRMFSDLKVALAEQKTAEEKITKEKEFTLGLLKYLKAGLTVVDQEGKHILVNDEFFKMLGYSEEELLNKMPPFDYWAEEGLSDINEVFAKTLSGVEGEYELIFKKKNGERVIVLVRPKKFVNTEGQVSYIAVFIDITERKQAEEALRETAAKLQAVVQASPLAIAATDLSGKIIMWNPAAERIFGWSESEIIRAPSASYVPADQQAIRREMRQRVLQGEAFVENDTRRLKKDGSIIDVTIYRAPLRDAQGKIKGIIALVADIGERKRAEAALRENEERFRLLAENAQDMVYRYRLAPAFKCEYISPAVIAITGYAPEEFYADPTLIFKITHPEDRLMMERAEHFPALLPIPFIFRLMHKYNGTVWIEQLNTLIHDQEETVVAIEGIARDITQRRKMEEEIIQYQEQLRSLASELSLAEERERRRMAIDLHDYICQPLAVSKIKLKEMNAKAPAEDTHARARKEILQLIEQTLQDTRLFISRLSPPVLYDLGFEAAVEWVGEQISQQHGILIAIEDDHEPKPLDDDIRVILFQAVRELLINVVKHARVKQARVSLYRKGDNIEITVTDEGMGFNPEEEYPQISKIGGFGLFSIRERLHHLAGRMEVKSEPSRGTEVTLLAPLKRHKKI